MSLGCARRRASSEEAEVKRCLIAGMLALASQIVPVATSAQDGLDVLGAQGNVFVLVGPGGNTTVQIGPEGPLLVDTQPALLSAQVVEAVRALTPRPIRHVVLTSGGDQQAGGAANLSKAGRYVRVIDSIDPRGLDARASIIAHLNVLNRMTKANVASESWPTDTYFTPEWSRFSNGEAVQLIHVPAAHSDGDTIVFFRRSDVVSAGAIFDATAYPRFDPGHGGSIDGIIEGLNRILDITVPGENQEGGTVVVPGRGRLSDETDVANYRDMVTIVRDRVRDMAAKGMPLEQVKRAKPTRDYDGLYDGQAREWTSDMFVEAIYRDTGGGRR
jgi:glyoxylase-like metal-dependent hydrolase (beta-lactamase superfamily II)